MAASKPVAPTPTLIIPSPLSFTPARAPPTPPLKKLAAPHSDIPPQVQNELQTLLTTQPPAPSPPAGDSRDAPQEPLIDLDDSQDIDPEVDSFLAASDDPKGKGKGKELPSPSPPPSPSVPSSSGSTKTHPFFKLAGFTPGHTPLHRNTKDGSLFRKQLDGLCSATAQLEDKTYGLYRDVMELGDSIPAALAQIEEYKKAPQKPALTPAELSYVADDVAARTGYAVPTLVDASNTLTKNQAAAMEILKQIDQRVYALETAQDKRIRELEAQVATLTTTLTALEGRLATPRAPDAPALAPPPLIPPPPAVVTVPGLGDIDPAVVAGVAQFISANITAKRAREEAADDPTRVVRQRFEPSVTPVAVPPAFNWTPASAVATPPAAPPLAPPSAPMPAPAAQRPPSAPSYMPPPSAPMPAPAAHRPPPLPAPPAQRPPPDPAREMLFGPAKFTKDTMGRVAPKVDVLSFYKAVLPNLDLKTVKFHTRPPDERELKSTYTVCMFETAEWANWMIGNWMSAERGMYSSITAKHPKA
ncbi:hypothetical protein R3P38DRAFT_2863159 [Favolaschia claudopus]|uniref:Uncharacterized protein n=1 Tax=Favolaschia claudopus TaxID=2862362 RepID=A0AAW0DJ73_9AGAR